MPDHKAQIDGVLGKGWYDDWQRMEKDVAAEVKRSALNEKRFNPVRATGVTDYLYWDTRRLKGVAADYRTIMNTICRGQAVNVKRTHDIHSVFTLSLGVVKHDNDALDSAHQMGLVTSIVALPLGMFQTTAKRLIQYLTVLKSALERARSERNQAYMQAGINAALVAITAILPPLGIVATGGVLLTQWFVDDALGPTTPAKTNRQSKGNLTVSHFASAISDIERVGSQTRKIAKGVARTTVVIGFMFDANEILVGHRNLAQITQAMSQARGVYNKLIAQVVRHRSTIVQFHRQYKRWQIALSSIRKNASEIRFALLEEMKRTGYPSRK